MQSAQKLTYHESAFPKSLFSAIHQSCNLDVIQYGLEHYHYTLYDVGTGYAWINLAVVRERYDVLEYIGSHASYTVSDMNAFLSTVTCTYNNEMKSEAAEKRVKAARAVIAAWVKRLPLNVAQSYHQGLPFLLHVLLACGEKVAIDAVNNRANIHLRTSSAISALHLAIMCHYPQLALLLIEKGIDTSIKDYLGASALNHALSYGEMHVVADQLIARGGLSTANPLFAYNSIKQVNKQEHIAYLDLLHKNHPDLKAEWKEYYYGKLCAHVFELDGHRILQSKRPERPFKRVWREGLTSPAKLLQKIAIATQEMDEIWPKYLVEQATDLAHFTSKNADLLDADYLSRIRVGKPTLIATGHWAHAWYIIFYRDFYILCNSNSLKAKFYRFDQRALTTLIIHQLRQQFTYARSRLDVNALLNEVNEALNVRSDPDEDYYAKHVPIKQQRIGNCMYKGFEMALAVYLVLEHIVNPRPYIAGIEATWMSAWLWHLRFSFLDNYLSIHDAGSVLYHPDYELLSAMRRSIRNSSIEPSYKSRADKAIDRINKISMADLSFSSVSHEGTDTCFAQYTVLERNMFNPSYQLMLQYRREPELENHKVYVPFKPV